MSASETVPESRPGSARLDGRRAVITGASRGIGRAVALSLARAGADVTLLARTSADLEQVAGEVLQQGGSATWRPCDLLDEEATAATIRELGAEPGGLQIVVNNVGGAPWLRSLEDVTPADFRHAMNLNLHATHNVMQAAAPALMASPGLASVINVTSIAAGKGLELMSFYSAAKAGVAGLSRAAAREWGPRGVRVNCVAPGWIETELSAGLRSTPEFFDETIDQIPLRRWGHPEEVASIVTFLASDASAYVTGTTVLADGGMLA